MSARRLLTVPVALAALALAGCSQASAQSGPGGLPACPASWQDADRAVLLWGDTDSQRGQVISDARLQMVGAFLRTAAACNARATVRWVPSQTQVTTLFDGPVRKDGETDIIVARLSNKVIDEVALPQVTAMVGELTAKPAPKGSSPIGLFDVAADDAAAGGPVVVVIMDNFVAVGQGVDLNSPDTTEASARRAAQGSTVPDLSGAAIVMTGVGVTADGTPAPDDWVRSIRAYADALCAKSKATCSPATTQYVEG